MVSDPELTIATLSVFEIKSLVQQLWEVTGNYKIIKLVSANENRINAIQYMDLLEVYIQLYRGTQNSVNLTVTDAKST